MAARSVFACEMSLAYSPAVHDGLRALVTQSYRPLSFGEKWALYDRAASFLVANQSSWWSGCWDFFDDDARARTDFNMWVQGMLTEEGARSSPLPFSGDPYRGHTRFLTFTMAVLMVQGTPSERRVAQALDIPEGRLWTRDTFTRVLLSVRLFNFASIQGSTLYLIPQEPTYALTSEDLRHPKFQYLRQIV
jgi:hypothetical protein